MKTIGCLLGYPGGSSVVAFFSSVLTSWPGSWTVIFTDRMQLNRDLTETPTDQAF